MQVLDAESNQNDSKSVLVVFTGPSGAGKSSIIQKLKENYPNRIGFSVSHTTRSPRPGEQNGVEYYFVPEEKFKDMIENNEFIEYANVHGRYYGTSFQAVETVLNRGQLCVLDVDVQGCRSIRQRSIKAIIIFISPPSLTELESRLRSRKTESEADVRKRIDDAEDEMKTCGEPNLYDLVVVNDFLDRAYNEARTFIAEYLNDKDQKFQLSL
ncbi:guanylate kinase [Galdieria sulphuraria]|uniref:guanylate kinase n=1 Tax=Galdieria sulphuraria TaxID=130081 RepID=M2Y173_GALSU|nr:guanylate kinase [Galdieria sulphuraria]EME29564.1 guanylate kinase [Galdieria sulphuraria]|eukprot:XP_005706084.1 guanylate kinase [Galdieria sulphuraria]